MTHIKRIFGKRKASTPGGEPVDAPDIYADMLRIDRMSVMEHPGAQEVVRSTKWKDKPDDPPGGNPTREMMTIRLIDPDDPNPDDPSAWIDLPVIRRMTTMRHPGAQETVTSFHPASAAVEPNSTARRVSVKRVTFAETNADATLDDTSYYADGSAYQRKADTVDTSQYLDVEVIESYPSTRHPGAQGVTVTMNNDLIKEMFADTPAGAPRGPVRLDPLQNLLNVCWGGGATEFPAGSQLARQVSVPDTPYLTVALWFYFDRNLDETLSYSLIEFGRFDFHDIPPSIGAKQWFTSPIWITNDQIGMYVEGPEDSVTIPNPEGPSGRDFASGTPSFGVSSNRGDVRDGWNFFAASFACDRPWDAAASMAVNCQSPSGGATFTAHYINIIGGVSYVFSPDDVTSTSFNIEMNGYEFALPRQFNGPDASGVGSADFRFANVQVWVGKYIDLTQAENVAKFMKPNSDDPTKPLMVSPSVAQAAFGKPTFFLDGPPSKFATNRGTGGEFTKAGELKSFRPAPPRAPQET